MKETWETQPMHQLFFWQSCYAVKVRELAALLLSESEEVVGAYCQVRKALRY